eukprot:GHVN01073292.1.p1 GENE.GHVN01073292.1~~GHVN01073292.1.p1  ORF type:complete len:122 (+),score=5.38 GHVN01073292.1:83-448(+)
MIHVFKLGLLWAVALSKVGLGFLTRGSFFRFDQKHVFPSKRRRSPLTLFKLKRLTFEGAIKTVEEGQPITAIYIDPACPKCQDLLAHVEAEGIDLAKRGIATKLVATSEAQKLQKKLRQFC